MDGGKGPLGVAQASECTHGWSYPKNTHVVAAHMKLVGEQFTTN